MERYITVAEALTTSAFTDSRVVSGHNGLQKTISHITVAEVPDSMEWLKGGELVVTTAYYIQDDPEAQERWLKGLIQHGAVALAIKISRFMGITPPSMKMISDEYAFPIIELPHHVTWPQIIEGVYGLILNRQATYLQRSEDIHKSLTKLVIESKGLDSITQTISNLVNNLVILCDQWFNVVAVGNGPKKSKLTDDTVAECLHEFVIEYFKPAAGANNLQSIGNKKFYSPVLQKELLAFPITIEGDINGFLLIVEQNAAVSEGDLIALEHGATVIALELLKQRATFEAEERLRLDILQNLLEQADLTDENFRKKAHIIGLNLEGPTVAIIISGEVFNIDNSNKAFLAHKRHLLIQSISAYLKKYDPRAFLVARYGDMVGFIHIGAADQRTEDSFIAYIAKEIEQINKRAGKQAIIAGIGKAYIEHQKYKRSYTEAQVAIDAAANFSLGSVVAFASLGYNRLLLLVNDRNELQRYCYDVLGPLLRSDKEGNLLETLTVYLVCNGNRNEISRNMFLHVNTVNYRISKIEDLLRVDLKSIEIRTTLFFALEIYRGLNNKKKYE